MKSIVLSGLMLFFFAGAMYSAETVLVLGFQNNGDSGYVDIDTILSKSLITMLGQVKGIKVAAFEASEKIAENTGFFSNSITNLDVIDTAGLAAKEKKVVYGSYMVDKAGKLDITYVIYNVALGEILYKREITADVSLSLFDGVDEIVEKIVLALTGDKISYITAKETGSFSQASTYTKIVIPACTALSFGGALAMKFVANKTTSDLNAALTAYEETRTDFDTYYATYTSLHEKLTTQRNLQMGFYIAGGVFSIAEAVLLIVKPGKEDSAVNWHFSPASVAVSYRF